MSENSMIGSVVMACTRAMRSAEAPIDVCPTCNTQLPATKVCDNYCS